MNTIIIIYCWKNIIIISTITPKSICSVHACGVFKGGGAGREKAYILNGHIFVNTYQNCTKFSVVVYCVDI